jgi:hypothetical protein
MINAYPAVWHINIPGIVLMISTGLYGAVICQAAIICHPTPVSIEYGSPEFLFFCPNRLARHPNMGLYST